MKVSRKLLAVLLVAAVAFSAWAGGAKDKGSSGASKSGPGIQKINSETGNTKKTDETLVVELASLPDFLWHPGTEGQSGTNEEQVIAGAIFDRLVDLDENTNEVIPMLAKSWEWVDDKSIKFTLRDDVKMTDGSPLVASDVVWCVNLWMETCAGNDTGAYFTGAKANDEHTVTIEFNAAAPELLKMLSWGNFSIVSEDEVKALGGLLAATKKPVMGSGKYKFKEWVSGQYIMLERNENYWDKNYAGYFKYIKVVGVNDPGARASSIMAGDAQLAGFMPVSQANSFAQNSALRTYVYGNGEGEHLFMNMAEGHPTSDVRVRQAIDKALNYDILAQIGTAGYGKPMNSYFVEGASYYEKTYSDAERAVDIEGAKKLLADAGYPNGLTLTTITIPDLADVYTVMQQNLSAVGIKLEIQNVDMGAFVPAMLFTKAYDIVAVGDNTMARTPQLPQFVRGGIVFGGPAVTLDTHTELLNKLVAAKTDAEAKALAKEYDALNKKDVMCTNLYPNHNSCLVGKDIKGFHIRERGYPDITTLYK